MRVIGPIELDATRVVLLLTSVLVASSGSAAQGEPPTAHHAVPAIDLGARVTDPVRVRHAGSTPDTHVIDALRFERNVGQWPEGVAFVARGRNYQVFLHGQGSTLTMRRPVRTLPDGDSPPAGRGPSRAPLEALHMRFEGARASLAMRGIQRSPTRVNYLRGRSPEAWIRDVPSYDRVRLDDVYPGIDIVYYGRDGALEFDFVVAPGADPGLIRVAFDGHQTLRTDDDGTLVLATAHGDFRLRLPSIHQDGPLGRETVSGDWVVLDDQLASFYVADWDRTRDLVIDPVLDFSTYVGGSGSEDGLDNMGVALDADGNIYVVGTSDSADLPTTGEIQDQFAGIADAFVTKIDPIEGSTLFTTYLGGASLDSGQAIGLDADGNIYVGGFTDSTDFPVVNALQPEIGGTFDGFIAKITGDGSNLIYSTYLGGAGRDFVLGLDVSPGGEVYLTGDVESEDFPTVNPLQDSFGGIWDAYVAHLNVTGDALLFSTYLGGSRLDSGQDIRVDDNGYIIVAGFTNSTDFAVEDAWQCEHQGDIDAFVTKIEPDGSAFVYSTYLGGESTDRVLALDLDAFGNAYVAGDTGSENFPSTGAIFEFQGFTDAFLVKLDGMGTLVYSTFFGGGVADNALALAVDRSGNAHVAGMTFSHTLPTVLAYQDTIGGEVDAFVATVDASGTRVPFQSFLGGSLDDRILGMAADDAGNIVVVGDTFSADFPLQNPVQKALDGIRDVFVTRFKPAVQSLQDPSVRVERVVAGMLDPQAMVPIGPDDILVLEKRGWVRHIRNGLLLETPVVALTVDTTVDGHPYAMAAHPAFPGQPWIYFYYTESSGVGENAAALGNRVYRYRWIDGQLVDPQLVLDIPLGTEPGQESGAMLFGPGDKLFVAAGYMGDTGLSQNNPEFTSADSSSVILRLEADGSVPPDNPFAAFGGPLAPYFAYGLHSSAAMAIEPARQSLWAADSGVLEYDEINVIEPGFNGGWSTITGPRSRGVEPPDPLVELPGSQYFDPVFSWRTPVVPRAMAFMTTASMGEHYVGDLMVGDAVRGNLYRLRVKPDRSGLFFLGEGLADGIADDDVETAEILFAAGFGSIADIKLGVDGFLYVLSAAKGALYRLYRDSSASIELRAPVRFISPGETLSVVMSLANHTDAELTFGLVVSLRMPTGEEPPVFGPLPVVLPAGASGALTLPLPMSADAQAGIWMLNGQIFSGDENAPSVLDRSELSFEIGAPPAE